MIFIKQITLLFLFICAIVSPTVAQVLFANADFKDSTRYSKIGAKQDSIYVFFKRDNAKLIAKNSSNTSFKWEKYNSSDNSYQLFRQENNVKEDIVATPDSGCYRVIINNRDTLRCWVIVDNFSVRTTIVANDCNALLLLAEISPSNLTRPYYYYDLENRYSTTGTPRIIIYPHVGTPYISTTPASGHITWKSEEDIFPDVKEPSLSWTTTRNPIINNPPPLVDSRYFLTLKNHFGNQTSDTTALIEAKAAYPISKIKTKSIKEGVLTEWKDEKTGKAPLFLQLAHDSKNTDTTIWKLYDNKYDFNLQNQLPALLFEPIRQAKNESTIDIDYAYQPGVYSVVLYAKNKFGCIDSLVDSLAVDSFLIDPSIIPTAFSPNEDGINDIFTMMAEESKFSSVWYLKIIIFNRSGQIMYDYEGKEGYINFQWNGKYKNSDTYCPSGVYYYYIEARGWDKYKHEKYEKFKGFVHLFRGS